MPNRFRTISRALARISEFVSHLLYDRTSIFDPSKSKDLAAKLVIIGSGPAGYTAAIYAARANLNPIVYEGAYTESKFPGGQLMTTTKVDNYPGFPEGIDGPELISNLRKQAEKFGAMLLQENALEVDLKQYPFSIKGQKTNKKALSIILATGASPNRPDIPGTRDGELWQRGVSTCAVCDGGLPAFRNRHIFVVGGGDSAMEEALHLSKFASKVFIVHRRDELRASKIMQKAVFNHPKIEIIWNSVIKEVRGKEKVESVSIRNVRTQEERVYEAAGVFFATGHIPNTAFLNGQVQLDPKGYIQVQPGTTQTNIPFVYAAGDVQDPVYRQAITSAATGCMAALDAEKALSLNLTSYK